jgi:Mg-chelatase subunit ChlD
MTSIAEAKSELAAVAAPAVDDELRRFIEIGAEVRAARSTEELLATLLAHAATGASPAPAGTFSTEALIGLVETAIKAHASGARVMVTVVDASASVELRRQLQRLDLLKQSKLY